MLAPGRHYIGDVIRIAVNYSSLGTDVDPEGVSLSIMDPSGTVVTYVYGSDPDVTLTDVGDYYCDYVIPQKSGRYKYRWTSTGVGTTSALEGDFLVQHSPFFDDVPRLYG